MADDSPATQVAQLAADARRALAKDFDDVLTDVRRYCDPLLEAVGHGALEREDALRAVRRRMLEKFDAHLPLRSHADPRLLELVRDALIFCDGIDDPDWDEWRKAARKVLLGDQVA